LPRSNSRRSVLSISSFPAAAMISVECGAETTDNQQNGFQSGQMAR
jgi:hypothetical protein